MKSALRVDDLMDRLCREEKALKDLGLHPNAEGVRIAVRIVLRMADATDPSIEPPGETDE